MKNKLSKVCIIILVVIFLAVLLVPSLIYANTQVLSNGEEVICNYVQLDNIETNSFKKIDTENDNTFYKVGLVLLGVSFVTLVAKGVYDLRSK